MAEQDKHFIAERVRHYIKEEHPGGATLDVLEDQIWHEEFGWHVPIQPDFEPKKMLEYFESLGHVEDQLIDLEELNVFLVPGTSKADMEEIRREREQQTAAVS